ncbi:hypothetical protein LSH36_217g00007 [Paralvinella palmiformis]|uniref:Uncharacterized protein n=1 Tax=Paralvinella palmiformis TaxID=53620 RepID=A0AAD9JPI9_9ANNE|nr:hypothetical protein LSH36_217g00007 [Paralvinella palmiformis]
MGRLTNWLINQSIDQSIYIFFTWVIEYATSDLPPPGSYDVQRAFSKTQDKICISKPRTESAKRKQGAFQSSSSRFAPPRDVVLAETDPSNPGLYTA